MSHTDTPEAIRAWLSQGGKKGAATRRAQIAARVAREYPDLSPDAQARLAEQLFRLRMAELAARGGAAFRRASAARKAAQSLQDGQE
jgi:hypothetical protein